MALGPGKYDNLATYVRQVTNAEGAVVIVVNGNLGNGISVQALENKIPPQTLALLLENTAQLIRSSLD